MRSNLIPRTEPPLYGFMRLCRLAPRCTCKIKNLTDTRRIAALEAKLWVREDAATAVQDGLDTHAIIVYHNPAPSIRMRLKPGLYLLAPQIGPMGFKILTQVWRAIDTHFRIEPAGHPLFMESVGMMPQPPCRGEDNPNARIGIENRSKYLEAMGRKLHPTFIPMWIGNQYTIDIEKDNRCGG